MDGSNHTRGSGNDNEPPNSADTSVGGKDAQSESQNSGEHSDRMPDTFPVAKASRLDR